MIADNWRRSGNGRALVARNECTVQVSIGFQRGQALSMIDNMGYEIRIAKLPRVSISSA
jgi:hypothetical protein